MNIPTCRSTARKLITLVLIASFGASLCLANHSDSGRSKKVRAALAELRKLKTVASTHTGVAGVPSAFGEVARELLKYGTEEDFLKLLKDRNPVARCMGLLCLAQSDHNKHADTLKKFLGDKEKIRLVVGCEVSDNSTVSEVAKLLLDDPRNMYYY